MGMYDTLNGEQIKFFIKPYIMLPDSFSNSSLGFSGGSLNSYDEGDDVPYKTFWYNYSKDFNIIDFFPYDHDELIVHMIRDGKNIGIKTLDKLTEDDFSCKSFNDRGALMNIKSTEDIHEYLKNVEIIDDVYKNKISRVAENKLFDYIRNHKKDSDYKEKYKELYYQSELERKNNRKLIDECCTRNDKFFINDSKFNDYETLGGLVKGLTSYIFDDMLKPNQRFFVHDSRLEFLSGYNEMNEILQKDNFINKYFKDMDFDENDIQNFKNHLNKIIDTFEKLQELKVEHTQFDGKLLSEIINGKNKDLYLKFNLLPYEGFDVSDWDLCKYDVQEEEYDNFQKELDDYVNQRLNEDNLER